MPVDDQMMRAAVQAYVDAFDRGDPDGAAALFAEEATVEDPVGSPPKAGIDAIRAFYAASMATGAKLRLQGPIRAVAPYAAFAFEVRLRWQGADMVIDVIDLFRFDDAGRIVDMRAFWGPSDMREA